MDLNIIFRELQSCARELGRYEDISINELADKYCEAMDVNDEHLKSVYFSALVLRFWYKISKLHDDNLTLNLDYVDYYDGLVDSIIQACDPSARVWQKNKSLNAKQVINQIIATRVVAQKYYESNLQKNLGKNFTVSLDMPMDQSSDDGKNTLRDLLADEAAVETDNDNSVYRLIQDYINNNKLIEAIIIDNIAFKDSIKYSKEKVNAVDEDGKAYKYNTYYATFWPYQVIKEISTIDDKYKEYFKNTYSVSEPAIEAAFKALHKANSQRKYKYLEATQCALKSAYGL